ncbi:MAG: PHP domain-containing protein [Alphaproteobacteria bacterium]|nr:PHP domain-containing protein [Alphaproteobacteria bacterium]
MIDLHTHSTFSDGTDTPSQLVQRAVCLEIEAIALTDHDVVNGCIEFQNAAKKYPDLTAINGCELGVNHPANVEIIALCISDLSPYLERQKHLLELRKLANIQRVELLKKAGFNISWNDVAFDEKGEERSVIAKPHIAQFLLKTAQVKDTEFVYKNLLAKGCPAYVKKQEPTVEETLDFIKQTGAVSILAHPCLIRLTGNDLFNEIKYFKQKGLDGIEVYHSDCSDVQMTEYNQIADALGLLKSGGSDYHGQNAHPGVELGIGRKNLNIPKHFLDAILSKQKECS